MIWVYLYGTGWTTQQGILLAMHSSCLIHLQLRWLNRENKPCPLYSPPFADFPAGCEPGCQLLIHCGWNPGDHGSFQQAVNSFAASVGHAISLAAALCCFLQHCTWLLFFARYLVFFFLVFAQVLTRICHYFIDFVFSPVSQKTLNTMDILPLMGTHMHSPH